MTPEKQRKLLAWLIADKSLWIKSMPFLNSEYFTDPESAKTIAYMKTFTLENKKVPTSAILHAELGFDPAEKFPAVAPTETEITYITKELETFYKQSKLQEFLIAGVSMLESGDVQYGQLEMDMKEIVRTSMQVDLGLNYFQSIEDRLNILDSDTFHVSTGFKNMDELMDGGWEPSELHIVAGGTGAGKSIFLANHAARNALQGKDVLIITLELAQNIFGLRFDSIFLDKSREIVMRDKARTERTICALNEATGGTLIIKYFPTGSLNTIMIESYIEHYLIENGKYPDIIYLDYLSLMQPNQHVSDYNSYTVEKLISIDLRGLAGELEIPIVTASQLNRAGMDSAVPDKTAISDSIGKVFTVGSLLNICQTKAEKAMGLTKLFAAKMRNSEDGWMAKFKLNYNTLKLTELEVIQNYGTEEIQARVNELQQGLEGIK